MDERGPQRPTGPIRRPAVQETSDPVRKPVAQWVISGKTVLPAEDVYGANPEATPPRTRWRLIAALVILAAASALLLFLR